LGEQADAVNRLTWYWPEEFVQLSALSEWQLQQAVSRLTTVQPFCRSTHREPLSLFFITLKMYLTKRYFKGTTCLDRRVSLPLIAPDDRMFIATLRTQAFVCFFTSVFTGPLFDMYGHKPLVAGGTVMLVFGFCMLSLCSQYYQVFICHALLISMGMDLL